MSRVGVFDLTDRAYYPDASGVFRGAETMRRFGIELELADFPYVEAAKSLLSLQGVDPNLFEPTKRYNLPYAKKCWYLKPDDSIATKDGECTHFWIPGTENWLGGELVGPPMSDIDKFESELDRVLCYLGTRYSYGLNPSLGLHVHIEAKDYGGSSFLNAVEWWFAHQGEMYEKYQVLPSRENYAPRFDEKFREELSAEEGVGSWGRRDIVDFLARTRRRVGGNHPRSHPRFRWGLNFDRLVRHGTVEFRIFNATDSVPEIKRIVTECRDAVDLWKA